MTYPPSPEDKPRKTWLWVTLGIVAVAAIAGGAFMIGQGAGGGEESAATSKPTKTDKPESMGMGEMGPSGCIAGNSTSVDALLEAQEKAGHDATGAAEFAAAFVRYNYRYPAPPAEDKDKVESTISPDAGFGFEEVQRGPDSLADIAPDGTPITISTLNGAAYLAPYEQDPDRAIVTISFQHVVNDVLLSTMGTTVTYELRWSDEGWLLEGAYKPEFNVNELEEVGTPFIRGC